MNTTTKTPSNGHDQYADSLFRPGASGPTPRAAAQRSKSRGRPAANVTRDASIRSAAAKGVKHSDLAAEHGLSEVRVWQIVNEWTPAAAKARKDQKKVAREAEFSAAEIIEGLSQRRAEERAKAAEGNRLAKLEAMLETVVKTVNQHADDGNADQKRIAALEARIADQESEIKLLWKRLDGINHELDDIEDALPPPKPKSSWTFWKRG